MLFVRSSVAAVAIMHLLHLLSSAPLTRFSDNYKDTRPVNMLGGDYGVDGNSRLSYNPAGYYSVTPGFSPELISSQDLSLGFTPSNPLSATTSFSNSLGTTSLTSATTRPFEYLYINMSMPEGADGWVTLTTKTPACNRRTLDSTYRSSLNTSLLTVSPTLPYQHEDGFRKHLQQLWPNDFVHNKDITFVALTPNVEFRFYYLTMTGDCAQMGTINTTAISVAPFQTAGAETTAATSALLTTSAGAATTARTTSPVTSAPAAAASTTTTKSGAAGNQAGFLATLGAIFGAFALF
ncbi:hypothetical protein BC829DRAFT_435939 [Chytridium lagenaria]|nr:hypothetical protein BC829DRAFT_435939 [Chytridium lagenaria]